FDALWCKENGGIIKFDNEYNINFNCTTTDFNATPYAKKIYNALCMPYYSAILNGGKPLFLKLRNNLEYSDDGIFDEFNFEITESELVRYI
ncbi:MAG: hypothetical protein LUE64_01715, partial [Candidatus Gastranaerophilales bacterium]|nr:hypothetical protein [Candidatus Gastranaerophilales bacterium]